MELETGRPAAALAQGPTLHDAEVTKHLAAWLERPVAQRQRSRQGRGRHGYQVGGARPGAGRPRADGQGLVPVNVRIGPEQIARARQLAGELGVKPAEVYRRALRGEVQLGSASKPYRRQTLKVAAATRDALRERAGAGDISTVVRGIFASEIGSL